MNAIQTSLMFLLSWIVAFSDPTNDGLIKSYFLHFHDFNDPKTLEGKIEEAEVKELNEYYIAFADVKGKVEKVEFLSSKTVNMTFKYSYAGKRVCGLTSFKYHDQTFTKCNTTYNKKIRTTECFSEDGTLISEEDYNQRTKSFSVVKYDSTGAMILHEWGKY